MLFFLCVLSILIIQFLPSMPDKAADVSEAEDDPEDDLKFLIPSHELLDNSSAKHKSDLVQRRIPMQKKPNLDTLWNKTPDPDMLTTPKNSNIKLVSRFYHCSKAYIYLSFIRTSFLTLKALMMALQFV